MPNISPVQVGRGEFSGILTVCRHPLNVGDIYNFFCHLLVGCVSVSIQSTRAHSARSAESGKLRKEKALRLREKSKTQSEICPDVQCECQTMLKNLKDKVA